MPSISDYLSLLESQHYTKPNFVAWVTAYLNILQDIVNFLQSIPSAFSVNDAVGVQLDVVGSWVGAQRNVGIPLSTGSSILDDEHFRFLIQAKIAQNNWNGTIPGLYSIWNTVFPETPIQIIDNQNMTMQAVITNLTDPISVELVTAGLIIPKPMGVSLSITANTTVTAEIYSGGLVSGGDIMTLGVPEAVRETAFVSPTQVTFYYEP